MIHAVSWRSTRAGWDAEHGNRQVAVVDLGSNSWRLVVFTYGGAGPNPGGSAPTSSMRPSGSAPGSAPPDACPTRRWSADSRRSACSGASAPPTGSVPSDVHAVATSAIRDADNGPEFVRAAQQATGLTIEVLSSEDEARFGYVAAVNTSTMTDGAVLEIGGGSMQLIRSPTGARTS